MDDKKPALSDDLKKVYDQVMSTPTGSTPPSSTPATPVQPTPVAPSTPPVAPKVTMPNPVTPPSATQPSSPATPTSAAPAPLSFNTQSTPPTSNPQPLGGGSITATPPPIKNESPSPNFSSIPPRPIKTAANGPISFSSGQGQPKVESKATTPVMTVKEHQGHAGGSKLLVVLLPLGLLFLVAYTVFWMVVFGLIDPKAYGF